MTKRSGKTKSVGFQGLVAKCLAMKPGTNLKFLYTSRRKPEAERQEQGKLFERLNKAGKGEFSVHGTYDGLGVQIHRHKPGVTDPMAWP